MEEREQTFGNILGYRSTAQIYTNLEYIASVTCVDFSLHDLPFGDGLMPLCCLVYVAVNFDSVEEVAHPVVRMQA